MRQSLILWS